MNSYSSTRSFASLTFHPVRVDARWRMAGFNWVRPSENALHANTLRPPVVFRRKEMKRRPIILKKKKSEIYAHHRLSLSLKIKCALPHYISSMPLLTLCRNCRCVTFSLSRTRTRRKTYKPDNECERRRDAHLHLFPRLPVARSTTLPELTCIMSRRYRFLVRVSAVKMISPCGTAKARDAAAVVVVVRINACE